MCLAVSWATSLPSLVTASLPLPARRPWPSNTLTLFFLRRCPTPADRRLATVRLRLTTFVTSNPNSLTDKPKSSAWFIRWKTSALRRSALVGMQPQFRQMPPKCSRSTSATVPPSWAARIAVT